MKLFFIVLFLCNPQVLFASTGGWLDRGSKPVPNTDAMKTINEFGAWLVITPDSDWEEKWRTTPETIPNFNTATSVMYGEKLTILTFFMNPKTDTAGKIDITCDIVVTRPDGSVSTDISELKCANGILQGNPYNIRLSAVINYTGDDGDPPGKWVVKVKVTDKVRNVTIALKTHFTLTVKKANKSFKRDGINMARFLIQHHAAP